MAAGAALNGEEIVTLFREAARVSADKESLNLVTLVGVVVKSGILVAIVGENECFVGENDVMKSLSSASSVFTDVSVFVVYQSFSVINNKQ